MCASVDPTTRSNPQPAFFVVVANICKHHGEWTAFGETAELLQPKEWRVRDITISEGDRMPLATPAPKQATHALTMVKNTARSLWASDVTFTVKRLKPHSFADFCISIFSERFHHVHIVARAAIFLVTRTSGLQDPLPYQRAVRTFDSQSHPFFQQHHLALFVIVKRCGSLYRRYRFARVHVCRVGQTHLRASVNVWHAKTIVEDEVEFLKALAVHMNFFHRGQFPASLSHISLYRGADGQPYVVLGHTQPFSHAIVCWAYRNLQLVTVEFADQGAGPLVS